MHGFSLLECLVVMVILSVFLLLALPTQSYVVVDEQSHIICSQLLRAIQASRTEAIFRHQDVLLCGTNDDTTCVSVWRDRYIMLSKDKVIATFNLPEQHGKVHWRAFPRGRDYLQFQSNGFTYFQNGTFWYCAGDAAYPRWAIMLSQTGRARVVMPDQQNEIRGGDGSSLMCA